VITGFGRCGDWFASSRLGLDPDIVTCAKGITSGYLPLGAVLASPRVAEPFWAPGAGIWRHGYTYSGHATVAAAAIANLDIMEREALPERALTLEAQLYDVLAPLADHELVEEVRGGVGVLAAVNLRQELVADDPMLPAAPAGVRGRGDVRPLVAGRSRPPLVIGREIAEIAGRSRRLTRSARDRSSEAAGAPAQWNERRRSRPGRPDCRS
jgi:adenosylmethionine-8-amino-7-oxononanoate aminotransferase